MSDETPRDGCGHHIAWLLIETRLHLSDRKKDKPRHEGIALTHAAKEQFMSADYPEGYSRTALPLRVFEVRDAH